MIIFTEVQEITCGFDLGFPDLEEIGIRFLNDPSIGKNTGTMNDAAHFSMAGSRLFKNRRQCWELTPVD